MKPEPVHKGATCSVCGLDWARHGANPTIEKCVELLKADLAVRPIQPQQPWQPYVPLSPYPAPWKPTYYPNITCTLGDATFTEKPPPPRDPSNRTC